jgi:hypothetical protein
VVLSSDLVKLAKFPIFFVTMCVYLDLYEHLCLQVITIDHQYNHRILYYYNGSIDIKMQPRWSAPLVLRSPALRSWDPSPAHQGVVPFYGI